LSLFEHTPRVSLIGTLFHKLFLANRTFSNLFPVFLWVQSYNGFKISIKISQWSITAITCTLKYRFFGVFQKRAGFVDLAPIYVCGVGYSGNLFKITRQICSVISKRMSKGIQIVFLVVIVYILKHVVNSEFELRRAFGINKKYFNHLFDANVEKEIKLSLK